MKNPICYFLTIAAAFFVLPSCDELLNEDDGPAPAADFKADHQDILPTSTVQFTDLSTGDPTSWWWEFGDGGTSLLQHPSHTYDALGEYDVKLTVTNDGGSDEILKTGFIRVAVETGATGTVTDADGNTYQTVKIGPQWWMAENLRVTQYADGGAIPFISEQEDWQAITVVDRAFTYYDYNIGNQEMGALYSGAAATNGLISTQNNPEYVRGVCPSGWHLPSDEEWQTLEINLGMLPSVANQYSYRGTDQGSQMAGGANQWLPGALINAPAFGKSGLDIRPYGFHQGGGVSQFFGEQAYYWTATAYGNGTGNNTWSRRLLHDFAGVFREFGDRKNGMYVRCVRDD